MNLRGLLPLDIKNTLFSLLCQYKKIKKGGWLMLELVKDGMYLITNVVILIFLIKHWRDR